MLMCKISGALRRIATLALLLPGAALADIQWNMPKGVTEISREVYHLHMEIFGVCVAIAVIVFGAMIWSIIYHRKSRGAKAASFHESTTVEIIWTILPFFILVGMAIPAARVLVHMEDSTHADMSIKVTGYQWKWRYDYLDSGVGFYSTLAAASNEARQKGSGIDPATVPNYLLDVDHPLVIPVGKKIRFLITSNDVIHSWWVPDFGRKQDVIPGFIHEMWVKVDQPGTYRGQCAELCGRDHGFMPIVVEAKPEAQYEAWLAQQKKDAGSSMNAAVRRADSEVAQVKSPAAAKAAGAGDMVDGAAAKPAGQAAGKLSKDELMADGERIYKSVCAACHQPDGKGLPPTFPALAGSKVATGPVKDHINIVLNGKAGTAMQAFRDQFNDRELAAIITYERNAFGNNTGDVVQPSDIKAAR